MPASWRRTPAGITARLLTRSTERDCDVCSLKAKCSPNSPERKIPSDVNEQARDFARSLAGTEAFDQSRRQRKKVEMRFAHLKGRQFCRDAQPAPPHVIALARPRVWAGGEPHEAT